MSKQAKLSKIWKIFWQIRVPVPYIKMPFSNLVGGIAQLLRKYIPGYKKLPLYIQKSISVLLIFTTLFTGGGIIYLFGPWSNNKVEAAWFDDNWLYRTPIAITNGSGGVLTDYQASFTINTTDTTKFQTSCQDIRVTDNSGKLLPYWIDENNPGCANASTKIWVRIPSIPTSGFTLYVYYGNPSAAAASDGDKVFAFFDGFNGSGLDTTKWTATAPASVSFASGAMTVTRGTVYTNTTPFSQPGYMVEARMKWNDLTTARAGLTIADQQSLTSGNGTAAYTAFLSSGSKSETHAPCALGLALDGFAADNHATSYNVANNLVQGCLVAGTNYIISEAITSSQVKFYQDRTLTNSYTGTWSALAYLYLGNFTGAGNGNTNNDDIVVDWVLVRQFAATEPTTANGTEEKATAPVAYWKFDEGTGTAVSDTTSNANNGTLGGTTVPTWQTEDQCISGKCLFFDGSTSKVTGSKAALNVQTVSFWLRPNTIATQGILDLNDASSRKINTNGSGVISASGFTSPTYYINGIATTTPTLVQNQWNYVSITTATGVNSGTAVTMGTDATNFIKGFIDEVKFYSYARSAPQVLADYNARSNNEGVSGALGSNAQNNPAALSQGLVGYWKMDEASGNAVDSSGNAVTLTNNNTTPFNGGKFGKAPTFNGSSTYFSTATTISSVQAIAFWAKPASTTDNYLNLTGSTVYITSSSGTVSATGVSSPSIYVNGVLNGTVSASSWNHIVITSTTSVSASQFEVGRANSSYAANNSQIDEVRLYNRVLSPADISTLYNFAPGPTAYWKIDEDSGQTINDSSGNGLSGTLGTDSSVASDDPTWTTGKYGSALNLDGSNDFVNITDSANINPVNAITISYWIYPISLGTMRPISKDDNGANREYLFQTTGAGAINFGFWNSGGTLNSANSANGVLTANNWYYVSGTYDGTTIKEYINGVLIASTSWAGQTLKDGTANLWFGRFAASQEQFAGKIDDVKFYNYARTQKQIIEDMNASHPAPGSPINTPVGYWKFDDGYGNGAAGAHNTGNCGSTCDGTITGMSSPATNTSGWTNSGKMGKALLFDGTNDYVAMPSDVSPLKITDAVTLSAWVNLTSTAAQRDIICKWTNTASTSSYCLYTNSSGQLVMGISDGAAITTTTETTQTLSVGTWYHVVGVYNPSNSVTLYINGIQVKQNTSSIPASLGANTTIVDIGAENVGTNPMNGTIDEAKVYAGALTGSEVLIDMNKNASQVLGSFTAANNTTTTPDTISGLKLWLKADSLGLSDGTAVSSWTDSSGTGNTATQATGANQPLYKTSIINGQPVVRFDGNNDFMNTGTTGFPSGNSDLTMITVFKATASGGVVYAYGANTNSTTPHISASSSTQINISTFGSNDLVTLPVSYLSQPTIATFKYTSSDGILRGYIRSPQVAASDSGIGAQNFSVAGGTVGAFVGGPNTFLNGDVAEVIVYNSALSDANRNIVESYLATKYNLANANSTIGASFNGAYCLPSDTEACGSASTEFNFEEGSGTTTQDTTGNGNTGTLRNGPVFVQGKIGKGISFDGTLSQDIAVTNEIGLGRNQDGSIEMWVKWSGTQDASCCSSFGNVFSRQNNNNYSNQVIGLSTNDPSTAKITWQPYSSGAPVITGATTVGNNTWRHIIITYSDGSHKLYIDGKLDGTATTTGTLSTGTNPSFLSALGSWSGDGAGYCTCIMDKVRTFNYVLSPNQVAFEYSKGAPVVFYKFDDCQGTTINDSSGNGYSGTLAGTGAGTTAVGTCTTSSSMWGGASGNSTTNAGKINYALTFDGTDDNVQSAAISPLIATTLTTTKASWGGWFNPVTSVASKTLIEKSKEFQLTTDASSIPICGIYYSAAFNNSAAPPTALTLSAWNHVMCVYDGTNINTYLNGLLIKQSAQANNITADGTTKLYLGQTSGGASFYQGRMDEVKVYNYALNAAQIKQIYTNGALNFAPSTGVP